VFHGDWGNNMWWQQYWTTILLAILALPILSVAAFAWWLKRWSHVDLENGVKCWEVFIKLVSALTIVVSGAMLFGKYIDQQGQVQSQRADHEKNELNLRKAEFLRQKLLFDTERHQRKRVLFDEAKTLAAGIANTEAPSRDALKRYDELYFAALIGVETLHGPVEKAMVRFRNKLKGMEIDPDNSLPQLALELSTACETELKESEDLILEQHQAITDLLTKSTSESPST
jgi:hypothetical protein